MTDDPTSPDAAWSRLADVRTMTGDEFRAARLSCDMTQADWAALLGVGREHVANIERGAKPASATLAKLVTLLLATYSHRPRQ